MDTNGTAYYDDINNCYVYPDNTYNDYAYEKLEYKRGV